MKVFPIVFRVPSFVQIICRVSQYPIIEFLLYGYSFCHKSEISVFSYLFLLLVEKVRKPRSCVLFYIINYLTYITMPDYGIRYTVFPFYKR